MEKREKTKVGVTVATLIAALVVVGFAWLGVEDTKEVIEIRQFITENGTTIFCELTDFDCYENAEVVEEEKVEEVVEN